MGDKEKVKVLFLCTGNACRSQIAEGWARHLKSDVMEAYSAGVWPAGISAKAVQVMAEAGVDISSHVSKHAYAYLGMDFDFVITLCDHAKAECPIYGDKTTLIHRAFKDPLAAAGGEEQVLDAFRKTRDQIRAFIETLPESLTAEGGSTETEGKDEA
ncbi:MAG: arsenate reductase [Planctomycetes bacterium RBG_16_55_9]|nr:MAG: arsenate reductase [Planctomycetes bacterium RBG_16_55_9]